MDILDGIDSVRATVAALRKIRQRHAEDTVTLNLVAEAEEGAIEQMGIFMQLYHYRGEEAETNGHAISSQAANGGQS